ncbi:MAG: hypothetical protein M1829_004826 [Trizodia sp. TS-e1964]|nr:MAG: hypothetical protein M1829_004826 [Trizodia sp. TS-e1964]
MEDVEDEPLILSSGALEALKDFYTERDERQEKFESFKSHIESEAVPDKISMDVFTEDWNASQFWYSESTATILAKELLDGADSDSYIGVVSAPSVFVQLKNLLASGSFSESPHIHLFEYDNRFDVFKEFVPYDFQYPLRLPAEFKGKFDRIICDPPFLNEHCQTREAMTVRWLSKEINNAPLPEQAQTLATRPTSSGPTKLIICTGERMESLICKLHGRAGVKTTDFKPAHDKGLSNEFNCYANFESGAWKWEQQI